MSIFVRTSATGDILALGDIMVVLNAFNPTVTGDGALEPFGLRLKRGREGRGMTLEGVAESTKIGTRFLRAIEEGQLEQLPGGIFNKGFIRAYGRCVGLDEEELIAGYLAAVSETQVAEAPLQTPAVESERARLSVGALAGVGLILLLGLVWYWLHSHRYFSRNKGRTSAAESIRTAVNVKPSPQPASLINKPASLIRNPASLIRTGPFTVNIQAREECWILLQVDKKNAEEITLEKGDEKSIQAIELVTVKVGNAGGVDFSLNGIRLPRQGGEEEVKTITLRPDGVQQTAKP